MLKKFFPSMNARISEESSHVLSGRLRYYIDGLDGRELALDPKNPGIVLPEVFHHVAADGPVLFLVEFHRRPGA